MQYCARHRRAGDPCPASALHALARPGMFDITAPLRSPHGEAMASRPSAAGDQGGAGSNAFGNMPRKKPQPNG